MQYPVAITRLALLTPFGPDTWGALREGRRLTDHSPVADEWLDADESLDRAARLALAVARRVDPPRDTPLFFATSKGPATTWLAALDRLARGDALTEQQARSVALGAGSLGFSVAERLGLTAPVHTSVAACSSGMHALHRASRAIARGEIDRALVLAGDASLHPLFTGSFERLGVVAPRDAAGRRACVPFGAAGAGFFLIEAAAALLLEARPVGDPLAWIEQVEIAADSTGLIAIDGQTVSLRHVLQRAALLGPPAFVHAHATGTAHDLHEMAAIRSVFSEVPVFSHKFWLGHSLAAAGLLAAGLSTLAHQHGVTPTGIVVNPAARSVTIAQGFGGHISVLGLRGSGQRP